MADFSKLNESKPKNRFGSPLKEQDASSILEAPEHAPAEPKTNSITKKARAKTGRTEPFSTRVSKEFETDFKQVAFQMNLKKVDLLEESLKAYKEKHGLI